MNRRSLLCLMFALLLLHGACSSLPKEDRLKAEVHYIAHGSKVDVVSASTNFEHYREVFLIGFAQGFADAIEQTLTVVDFRAGAEKNAYFHDLGARLGARAAHEIMTEQPNQSPERTRASARVAQL